VAESAIRSSLGAKPPERAAALRTKRTLRRTLVWIMLATLFGVALPTLSVVAWMNYSAAQVNLEWTRRQIREGLIAKGSVLVDNHAIALRSLVVDNAFADVSSVVSSAVTQDEDVVYGLFLSAEQVPWVFVAPGVDGIRQTEPNAWKILKIDAASLEARTRQIRQLERFGQAIYEFSMPVLDPEGREPLGTIRYGLSMRRTERALAEARARAEHDLLRTLELLSAIVVAALFLGIAIVVRQSRRITQPLLNLTDVARTIAAGDREVRADVHSGDEIEVLGGAFNQMVSDLNASYGSLREATHELKVMNETLETQVAERTQELSRALDEIWSEMDLARKVQTVLLPQKTELPDYQIAALMRPADAVGGDYYDLIRAPASDWLLIGDVSGHGVTAGLTMMIVQTAVHSVILAGGSDADALSPSRLLSRVNTAVQRNLHAINPDQYMTMVALQLEPGTVTYAGLHDYILVYRGRSRSVERLETRGVWLGVLDDVSAELENDRFDLEQGDVFLLYTDGLTEAVVEPPRTRLGPDRLQARFHELAAQTSDVAAILSGIMDLVKDRPIADDVTAMVVRYAPREARMPAIGAASGVRDFQAGVG
jgi:serine phosphatase RsbU (regulator of sigma subunit)